MKEESCATAPARKRATAARMDFMAQSSCGEETDSGRSTGHCGEINIFNSDPRATLCLRPNLFIHTYVIIITIILCYNHKVPPRTNSSENCTMNQTIADQA